MEQIYQFLIEQLLFDYNIMTNIWMYIPFFIPISFYLVFFMIKWVMLTFPFWIPFAILINCFSKLNTSNKNL